MVLGSSYFADLDESSAVVIFFKSVVWYWGVFQFFVKTHKKGLEKFGKFSGRYTHWDHLDIAGIS